MSGSVERAQRSPKTGLLTMFVLVCSPLQNRMFTFSNSLLLRKWKSCLKGFTSYLCVLFDCETLKIWKVLLLHFWLNGSLPYIQLFVYCILPAGKNSCHYWQRVWFRLWCKHHTKVVVMLCWLRTLKSVQVDSRSCVRSINTVQLVHLCVI